MANLRVFIIRSFYFVPYLSSFVYVPQHPIYVMVAVCPETSFCLSLFGTYFWIFVGGAIT